MSDKSLSEEIFPNIQTPPVQLEITSSGPITSYLGEETKTLLAAMSFQGVVDSNKVTSFSPA